MPCMGSKPASSTKSDIVPLMCFLADIIVPEDLSYPAQLMHWVHCLSFEACNQKHGRVGLIPDNGWNSPNFILMRRKGAAQCHAIVLCSLLLGAKKDAYVCKGTTTVKFPAREGQRESDGLIEHFWV